MAEVSIDPQSPEDKINETLRIAKFEADRCLRSLALDTSDERLFYVYAIFLPNGQIRYVGKGKGYRVNKHSRANVKHRNYLLANDYKQHGKLPSFIIVDSLTNDESLLVEDTLIQFWGIEGDGTGPLANLVYGGGGAPNPSPVVRAKMSASQTRANASPDLRARKSASVIETNKDPEVKARRSSAMKRTCNTPEWQSHHSASMKAKWSIPEFREMYSEHARRNNARPEKSHQQSSMMLAYWEERSEKYEVRGEILNVNQIAAKYGFPYKTIYKRARNGKRGEELIKPVLRHK